MIVSISNTGRAGASALGVLIVVAGVLLAFAGPAQAISRSCAWQLQATADETNIAYPDQHAAYWLSDLPIPSGGHIEIEAQYPHARYTSLITYNAQSQAIDGIHDTQIKPNPGSRNPFLAGANRNAAHRSYTVQIVNQRIPASGRAQNTLYTENADGSKSTKNESLASFMLRIYVPNRGDEIDGGVPLPSVSVVSSSGQKTTFPDCPDVIPDTGVNETLAASGSGAAFPGLPVSATPAWHKYTNLATHQATIYGAGTPIPGAVTPTTDQAIGSGGFWENVDNKYIYTQMDQTLGQVLVLHAKAPTTPRTLEGEKRMGTGQLRYWSICSNNPQTTQFYGCAYDEQVPVDKHGYYTFVISTAAARPSNATLACGIAWLPAGPLARTELIMRNMLPAPGFKRAIQNARVGHEQQDLGAYYPTGRYYASALGFERNGCSRPAGSGR
ncbi:MAG TPA: hypothetical protein VGY32_09625 [Solirubrobacteraceae bacterium]|nr:hypothetical protein [Solirubrobacteraceae bacterium]